MFDPSTLLTPETFGPAVLVAGYFELRLRSKIRSALPCGTQCPHVWTPADGDRRAPVDLVPAPPSSTTSPRPTAAKVFALFLCVLLASGCGSPIAILGDINRDADVDGAWVTRVKKEPGKSTPVITVRTIEVPELEETPSK